jgi:hypothetical protein
MIVTKLMLEEKYGLMVMPLGVPVSLIAGNAVVAHVVKYENFEQLETTEWFKDILANKYDIPIFIMTLDKDLNPEGICLRVFVKELY